MIAAREGSVRALQLLLEKKAFWDARDQVVTAEKKMSR